MCALDQISRTFFNQRLAAAAAPINQPTAYTETDKEIQPFVDFGSQ